jgi:hypothetical protein
VHLGGASSRLLFGGGELDVKHEAYYRFCEQHLGALHTAALRAVNASGALLRLALFAARRAVRPTAANRSAIAAYRGALRAHAGRMAP